MPDSIENIVEFSDSLESLANSKDLYIVFVDLCDSTEFKQFCIDSEMPDSVWIQRQLVFLSRVGNLIRLSGGTIIKTIGDELMGTFDKETSISKIVDCYLTIHGTFENLRAYNKGRFKIKVKGAIDFGECYNGNVLGDIFDPIGTSVDRCARMMKHANSSSLLFSDNAFSEDELVKAKKSFTLSEFTESFKGLGATHFWGLNI